MGLIINSYSQLATDRQKERAREFVNRSDRDVTSMAVRSYNITHHNQNKKITDRVGLAIKSLPVVALASGLMLKKGIKPSLKQSALWGVAIAMPAIVTKTAKALSQPDENGKKRCNMSMGSHILCTLAGYIGASAILEKLSKSQKVNSIADTMIDGAKNTYNNLRSEINMPKGLSEKISNIKDSVKSNNYYKEASKFIKESNVCQAAYSTTKKVGKKVIEHAPGLVAIGALLGILAPAVKQGIEISSTKSKIKNAQLNTARDLIDAYAEENEALKSQNS